jgi:hypothetical protein
MNEPRLEKLAPLTGVIAVVRFSTGAALLRACDCLVLTASREILGEMATNGSIGGYMGSISAFGSG